MTCAQLSECEHKKAHAPVSLGLVAVVYATFNSLLSLAKNCDLCVQPSVRGLSHYGNKMFAIMRYKL